MPKKVALILDPSKAYDRKVVSGIPRYLKKGKDWELYLEDELLAKFPDFDSWNGDGVEPDIVIEGEGEDYDETRLDQLRQVLEHFESGGEPVEEAEAA